MKRCPECQFLYDNESTCCDMDGTPLRYTVKLPTVPGLAQSIWDKWTIALLCAVVAVTVLVILYRATPRAYTSSAARQMKSAKNETPALNQSLTSGDSAAPSESSATQPATDDSDSSTDSQDPFAAPSTTGTKAQRSKRGLQTIDEKEPTPAPAIHVQVLDNSQKIEASSAAAQPLTNQTTTVEASAQKPASSATSASVHPLPPAATFKPTPPAQKKESGFKSMLKKAGKVLKKPFGEN